MSFELVVAAKRDPLDRPGVEFAPAPFTSMTLNGVLSRSASQEVLDAITSLFEGGAESIIVEMQSIDGDEPESLEFLTRGLMKLRGSGRHVQISVRDLPLHTRMAELPHARDWLIAYTDPTADTARRAIHVDHDRSAP